MPTRPWQMLALALPPLLFASAQAHAQDRRREAEAYPCGAIPKLEIVPQDGGFSIEAASPSNHAPAPQALAAMIAVGRALRIDRALFEASARATREVADAPHP